MKRIKEIASQDWRLIIAIATLGGAFTWLIEGAWKPGLTVFVVMALTLVAVVVLIELGTTHRHHGRRTDKDETEG